MHKVLEPLCKAVDEVEVAIVDPDEPIHPGEKVIGVASPAAQKLYSYAHQLNEQSYEMKDKGQLMEGFELYCVSDILKKAFWIVIREDIGTAAKDTAFSLGIRTGFEIVDRTMNVVEEGGISDKVSELAAKLGIRR
jgi:hypothetical protein